MTDDPKQSADAPSLAVIDGRRIDLDQTRHLVDFLSAAFISWPFASSMLDPYEHFSWKIRDFPGGSSVLMASSGSRVVGLYVVLHRRWLVTGTPRSIRDVVDLSVAADFRSRGIFGSMSQYAQTHVNPDFDLSLVYLERPQTLRVGRRAGDRPPGNRISVLVRVASPSRFAGRLRNHGSRVPVALLAAGLRAVAFANRVRHPSSPPEEIAWGIRTINRFEGGPVERFIEEASSAFDLIQERSPQYLNWRYADPRGGRFMIRVAAEGDQVLGFAVTSSSGDRGYMVDLLVLPGRTDVARSLIDDATMVLDATEDVSHTICWLPTHHPYYSLMRSAGFIESRKDIGAAYRPLAIQPEKLSFLEDKRARIHLMIGDSDHV